MRPAAALVILATLAGAQTPAGKWISNLKYFDEDNFARMELAVNGTKLTGKFGGDAFEGTLLNGAINAMVRANEHETLQLKGRFTGDRITGSAIILEWKAEFQWEAVRDSSSGGPPKTHTFQPTKFHNHFSSAIEPALRIHPGDTVKTWSVDASGGDPKGARITAGGNPLTGPFYIEGALPGDTLVVHFHKIRLNRDSATSDSPVVGSALTPGYVESRKKIDNYNSDWKLDRTAGFAMLQKPTERLKDYKVPLAPMLGCVGVAPPGRNQYRSGYLGSFGGNLDYNQVREGVTSYLPVYQAGALLSIGDGHASQGDGEITGQGLETSMDVEFSVDLIRNQLLDQPWAENTVLANAIHYDVAEIVDPQFHVVARISKGSLTQLPKAPIPKRMFCQAGWGCRVSR
jgi:amidase